MTWTAPKSRSTATRSRAPTTDTSSRPDYPLLLFNDQGDCVAAKLRPGNVHNADGWEELLLPEIERQQEQGKEVAFRGGAAFARPEVYEAHEARQVKYAIRLPANANLERRITKLLIRPVERPSYKPVVRYKELFLPGGELDQGAQSGGEGGVPVWGAVPACWLHRDQLPDFKPLVRFYNQRATAEQWIKEGKQAVAMTRLSCHRFQANQCGCGSV